MTDQLSDDVQFWRLFNERSITAPDFGHTAHVRAAYLALKHHPFDEAAGVIREGLRALLEKAQRDGFAPTTGYHETITLFWLRVVAMHMARGEFADSHDFLRRTPELLDKRLMLRHYSKDHLMSDEARARFVEPDLAPLPDEPSPTP